MPNTKSLRPFPTPILFALLVGAAAACGTDPGRLSAHAAAPQLVSRLEADGSFVAGGAVPIGFTLHNGGDREVHVLPWNTPLEGVRNHIFTVTRDGEELPYRGIMVSRAEPTAASYVTIAAGQSAARTVDLAEVYDLSVPGTYTVEFLGRIHDCVTDGSVRPRVGRRSWLLVPSAPIEFRIVAR